jgi:hypothetical protein
MRCLPTRPDGIVQPSIIGVLQNLTSAVQVYTAQGFTICLETARRVKKKSRLVPARGDLQIRAG